MNKPIKIFLKVFLSIILVGIFVLIGLVVGVFSGLIDITKSLNIDEYNLDLSSYVYCVDPQTNEYVEYERLYADENRVWVNLDEIPKHVQLAAVAIEDERFYSHSGVDFKSTFKAAYNYFFKNSTSRGGSTITQQLVKNLTGDSEKNVNRKLNEMLRAIQLESKLSKDEILELYLNSIYLSQGCNGLKSASKFYYNKDVSELTIAEGAALVGITQYPTKFDPLIHPEDNKEKQELVLKKMYELGFINKDEYVDAVNEELKFVGKINSSAISKQSYFVDEIIREVIDDLQEEYGYTESVATKMLYSGGLKIYSTLDPDIQKIADKVFSDPANLRGGYNGVPQASICIMDPYNGEVKAIVGGFGEKEGTLTLNRATDTFRQPGSTIKPISVYAPALNKGLITPSSVYADRKLTIGNWSPKNHYAGFKGNVTVKHAVDLSINTVPVQILQKLGVNESFDFLQEKLGVTSLTPEDKSLAALALGGLTKGISNMELTAAYCSFVNDGVYNSPITYTKILDSKGKVILDKKTKTNVAMKTSTARTVNGLLKSVCDVGTGTQARFNSKYSVAGKTGTTDNDKDRWFVGYTAYYCAAVWVGYDTPSSLSFYSTNPTIPLWKKVMKEVHENKNLPSKKFMTNSVYAKETYETVDTPIKICSDSGLLATELCPSDKVIEQQLSKSPSEYCTVHKNTTELSNDTQVQNGEDINVEADTTADDVDSNGVTKVTTDNSDNSLPNDIVGGDNVSSGVVESQNSENSAKQNDDSNISDIPKNDSLNDSESYVEYDSAEQSSVSNTNNISQNNPNSDSESYVEENATSQDGNVGRI